MIEITIEGFGSIAEVFFIFEKVLDIERKCGIILLKGIKNAVCFPYEAYQYNTLNKIEFLMYLQKDNLLRAEWFIWKEGYTNG